jgi:hypothetical protein
MSKATQGVFLGAHNDSSRDSKRYKVDHYDTAESEWDLDYAHRWTVRLLAALQRRNDVRWGSIHRLYHRMSRKYSLNATYGAGPHRPRWVAFMRRLKEASMPRYIRKDDPLRMFLNKGPRASEYALETLDGYD